MWEYLIDGAAAGETARHNRAVLDAVRLVPRVLTGGAVTTTATLLGRSVAAPLLVAPMAAQRLAHPDGELATAAAAAAAGIPMALSTSSTTPVEEIAAVDGLDLWFQLYPFADDADTDRLVDRALTAGARAIVLTVDIPVLPGRTPIGRSVALSAGMQFAHHPPTPEPKPALGWADVSRLIERTAAPVVVKGVLHPDDVARAAEVGAAAVVLSNHGGRTLEGLISPVSALALGAPDRIHRVPRYVDGSIETAVDLVRVLALGADAALVGRALLGVLAHDGAEAARRWLAQFVEEFAWVLATVGVADPTQLSAAQLAAPDPA